MSFVDGNGRARVQGPGMKVIVGPADGARRLLLARGTLPGGGSGAVHHHDGDEVVRVVSGTVGFLVGGERKSCTAGEIAVIPRGTEHGFVVESAEAVMEFIAEQNMGSFFTVRTSTGAVEKIEVHRAEIPWDRPPPDGQAHTSAEEMAELSRRAVEPI
jgi:quercetin dioxygenase-like cupin family protein